jgi:outer membrane protein assembly factor BamB
MRILFFEAAAKDDSMISSIVADENFVVFATDSGGVVSTLADKPKRLWSFYAAEGICGPIVRDGKSLFFASKDTNVYKVNILTGELVWKYQTAAMLERSPRVSERVVYQYVSGQGLAALDKKNGELIWELAKGADLLTETDGKAYVITNTGKLVVMDNKKGKQRYSVNFAGVSRYASNVADSKIYIADESGRLACLEPVE